MNEKTYSENELRNIVKEEVSKSAKRSNYNDWLKNNALYQIVGGVGFILLVLILAVIFG